MRSTPVTTDGWRGLPGPGWAEPQLLAALDHAATSGALGPGPVVVGFDGRAGSAELALLAAGLLTHCGITSQLADGPAPTPALGHFVRTQPRLSAAVIVTASHNPPGYTGIKVRDHRGLGLAWPQPPDGAALDPDTIPRHRPRRVNVTGSYLAAVGRDLGAAAGRFDGDIVLDAAHGAVGALGSRLPGIEVVRGRVLPFFAGLTPDPVPRPAAEHTARQVLAAATDPGRVLVAMTDGDGDRLVVATARSGCVSSPEQAAALLTSGVPAGRLFTTVVAPRLATAAAERAGVPVTETPVGFKHLVAAWQESGAGRALGLEPNGALVHTTDADGCFERDALAALATLLRAFPSVGAFDGAVARVRELSPYRQLVHTTPLPLTETAEAVEALLPEWHQDASSGGVLVWEDGAHGRIAVRASGTEPGTRLYIEAPETVTEALVSAVRGPG
ncbi:hypothetical protein [Streptomyces tsukubensis]|uniref:hypothetical protein n=1 Tax=Streptomyces tsukubensis TaxID=83656 RepID=UPI00344E53A7